MTEISRTQFVLAAVAVVVVVLVGSRALTSSPAAQQTSMLPAEPSTAARVEPPPAPVATPVYVHVAGRVRRPGLYRLHAGSRIADALRRAGGRAHGADLDAINLAAKVHDGDQVLVPRKSAVAAGSVVPAAGQTGVGGAATPAAVVSLNSATEEQLETIDGVGPATAAKIIAFRQQHGGFRTVDDLAQISGIGPKKLAAMRLHVRV